MRFFPCFFYRFNIITIRNRTASRCFDPSKQGQAGFGVGLPTMPGDELAFQSGKEVLGHRVVVRITDRSDGRARTHFLAAFAKRNTDSETTFIGRDVGDQNTQRNRSLHCIDYTF